MSYPDNETSSFFLKKKDELELEGVLSVHSNETLAFINCQFNILE